MTDPCICGHDEEEHAVRAGCLAITDGDRGLCCYCWQYDPGPPF